MNRKRLWTIIAAQFKASPYKTGALSILMVVLLVLVGRQLSRGPRSAEAAPSLAPVAIGIAPIPELKPAPARPARLPLPNLPDTPARDLFETDWSAYGRVSWPDVDVREGEDESQSKAAPVLALELTLTEPVDGGQPCAVINGRRVRIGDAIGELVVESIAPGVVILTGDGSERILLRMD